MNLKRFQNIRSRLTTWHILVFGGILVVYAVGTFGFLFLTLNRQLDESLKEDLEIVEQLLVRTPEGFLFQDQHNEKADRLERFVEIWSNDGRLLFRSKLLGDRSLGEMPTPEERDESVRIKSISLSDGTHWRVASTGHVLQNAKVLIRLAVSEGEFYSDLRNFTSVLIIGIPVGLLLVALSGYMMAWAALRPIDAMARTALRFSAQNLKERIPIRNPNDELGHLGLAFNDLLTRVDSSFEQLKRFTADASHELRSPLTAMRSVGEVGLQGEHNPSEYREIIGSMLEESSRLTKLVDSLLLLSRADAGRYKVRTELIDLLSLAKDVVTILAVLAEEKDQNLKVEGCPGIVVLADRELLRQAVLNLIDNAIKFSTIGSEIGIKVSQGDRGSGWLEVIDHGPGIPVDEQAKVFERFYRADRGRTSGGEGLGLAIVRWAVEANSGTVTIKSGDGSGSTFLISIPLAQP